MPLTIEELKRELTEVFEKMEAFDHILRQDKTLSPLTEEPLSTFTSLIVFKKVVSLIGQYLDLDPNMLSELSRKN